MNPASSESNEGRIIAQRKVLAEILAHLARSDPALLDNLDAGSVFSAHEEDPGSEPSSEFAIENAMAEETRLILETARRRLGPGD